MAYLKLTIQADSVLAEHFSSALQHLNALSVTLEDAGDSPVFQEQPGEHPLWQRVRLSALFEETVSLDEVVFEMKVLCDIQEPINYKIERVADEDWVRLTQRYFKPLHFNDALTVCPSWEDAASFTNPVLFLDPGLAFGTGGHATTKLCLQYLVEHLPEGQRVFDYGCGSGVLGLAALLLGAQSVEAVDHDAQAMVATGNNLALNQSTIDRDKINMVLSQDFLPGKEADLILANILSNALIDLEPRFAQWVKEGGSVVLSGILENEVEMVSEVYRNHFDVLSIEQCDGWVRMDCQKCSS